jgi:hypothetical protein
MTIFFFQGRGHCLSMKFCIYFETLNIFKDESVERCIPKG